MIDKKAYQKMDYALCLLSAHADGKDSGCIINSFHQVTSSFPAKFTIAVNRENVTAAAVEQAGSFCVTLLAHDAPAALINDFGYRSGRVADKFSPYEVRRDEVGNPYLTDSMVSRVSCRVIDRKLHALCRAGDGGRGVRQRRGADAQRLRRAGQGCTTHRHGVPRNGRRRLQMQCLRVHPRERNITR